MKINFTKLPVPNDPKMIDFREVNIKKELANHIFQSTSDIEGHRISEKIYDSESETELTEQERAYLLNWLPNSGLTNAFRLGIERVLNLPQ